MGPWTGLGGDLVTTEMGLWWASGDAFTGMTVLGSPWPPDESQGSRGSENLGLLMSNDLGHVHKNQVCEIQWVQ